MQYTIFNFQVRHKALFLQYLFQSTNIIIIMSFPGLVEDENTINLTIETTQSAELTMLPSLSARKFNYVSILW